MKKLLFSIIILAFLISACAKEESPFTPKDPDTEVDYDYDLYPEDFSYDSGNGIYRLECKAYSDSPYIISYDVYTSWYPNLPLGQWTKYTKMDSSYDQNNPDDPFYTDDPHSDYNGKLYYIVKEYLNSPLAIISNYSPPNLIEVKAGDMEEKYSFRYPTFEITVISTNSFYLQRYYRTQAIDIYGRETEPVIKSVNYCRIEAAFIGAQDDPLPSFYDANIRGGIGRVIPIGNNTYTIKLDFNEYILRRISWCYGGRAKLYGIRIQDLYGKEEQSTSNGTKSDVIVPNGQDFIINVEFYGSSDNWGWEDCGGYN